MKYYIYKLYYILFPIMVSLMGCGQLPELPRGVYIDPYPYQMEDVQDRVDRALAIIEDRVDPAFRQKLDEMLRIEISFSDTYIECGDDLTNGCTWQGMSKQVKVQAMYDDVGCTPLGHELLHTAINDPEHDDPGMWDDRESIEMLLFQTMCDQW